MSNGRFFVAAVVTLAATAAVAGSATSAGGAAGKTITVTEGLHGLALERSSCGAERFAGEAVHIPGPGKPPLGKGSLELRGEGINSLFQPISTAASALTNYSYFSRGTPQDPGAANSDAVIAVSVSSTQQDLLYDEPTDTGKWQQVTPTSDTLEVVHQALPSGDDTDGGTTTWADYQAANPTLLLEGVYLDTYACIDRTTTLDLDAISSTISGKTTTLNFEPEAAGTVSISAPKHAAKAKEITVAGFFDYHGKPVGNGETFILQAKAKGHGWTNAEQVPEAWNGALHSIQFLTSTTKFRWYFPGDTALGQIQSKAITVKVGKAKAKKH